jgi:hypothetical protein
MKSERSVLLNNDPSCPTCVEKKGFCWSSVFAGAFVGLGLSFLLNLFGFAIGLSAFTTSTEGMKAFAIGGFLGLALITMISMYFGGMVTGYIARPRCFKRHMATVYGFTTWAVMLFASILLASHMGNFVNYSTSRLSSPTVVKYTNDQNAPVATDTSTPSSDQTTVNADKATNVLGTAAFITFFLFALGAIFACMGAHHGLCCRREDGVEIK